jgi:hypothetical protein
VKRFLFLVLAVLAPLALWAQVPNQLVTISSDGKHLVNSITGQPVFLTGDSPQLLSIMLSNADVNTYLQDRAARGFNAIWVISTDQLDQTSPPKDFFGNVPFDGAWFTSPDPAYWAHQDSVIQAAQALGITVFLMPSFVGNNDGDVYDTPAYRASTVATIQGYGTFIGDRYKGFNNIVYVLGGDYNPTDATIKPKLEALAAAIAAADPNHLITIEGCQNCGAPLSTTPYTSSTIPPWLGTNWTDTTQANAVASCQAAFSSNPFLPPFEGEDWYELEHGITGFQARQEGYWEVLSGCYVGRLFGNGPIWSFNAPHAGDTSPSWQSQLSSPGSLGEQFMGQLMRSREHWLMVPDKAHTVLTAGFGSASTLSVAARSSDGQTVIAYFSDGNATAKTISMSSIVSSSSTAVAWWYAPLTGAATLIGTFPNSGSQSFTAPDGNDWVLVIDDAAANLGAPGGGTGNNPVPSITSVNPLSAAAGGPAFTLTVNGSGFISSSVVNFNGSARTTTFVSATQIKASILASDIATSGTANVTATNPAPGGGTTPNVAFTISSASNPVPTLASISPTSGPLGQSVALTLTGTNFISSSIVNFGSNQNTGGVVSNGGNTLTITIPAAQLATAGPISVTVTNPTPGGGTTGAQTFTVNNSAGPSITTISPTSATVNGSGFTLTVNGGNFVNGSVVNFNGAAKATTFVSATKVTASILAADLLAVGNFPVTVTNPAPGGGTSAAVTFAVTNLSQSLTSISPSSATAGGAAFALTLTGTGFVSGASVNFGTATITPSSVTSTQIVATIPAADIAAAGTVNVTVTNPAGGGTSNAQTFTVNNPAPTEVSIAPPSANAGGAAFTLTVTGTGFVSGAVVKFNGTAKTTTFVSATQVTAAIATADIATAGTVNVAVTNPAPGGGTSGNIQFTINNPNVTVTSLSPASATAGGAGFTLTISGSGFASGATVNFGGNPAITPSSVTSTQIVANIPAADIAAGGTANVTVTNPPPSGGISSAQTFTINNPAPTTSSLSPTSATAGGAGFTLTVNGTGFVPGSIVKFNGVAKVTSVIGSTQITAAISAADIATAGPVSVTVTNPAPGGGTSNAQTFTINNPSNLTITSLSPASATAGSAAFTLTVNGSGFVSGATVQFNGANRTTTFVSSTQVTAAILAADIATAGTASVTVTNPAPSGGTSNTQTFTINSTSNLTITSLSPSSTTAGGAAFTLTVNGTDFVSGSVVKFGGTAKTTTFKSATQVTAAIAASDIASGGVQSITVTNPAPGGGTSGAATFTVNNSVPTLSSLSPPSVFAGSGAFTLTVNGTGFVNGASVQFNGAGRTTTFVSSTQVTAAILASDIVATGTANVTVTNPSPTTGPSASLALNITNENNPIPAISALDTTHVTGGAAFTLSVNGSNFEAKSVVNLNGKAEATTFVSTTRISAAIPASDVAVAGSMNVTVTNPAPGGGTSSAFAIVVDGYTVGGSSTASVASGQPATLQITVTPTAKGFSNPVAFSISGLPSGVSALFAPASVTPGGKAATTMLTITDGGAAASRAKSQAGISGGGIAPTLLFGVIVLLAWLGFETRDRSIPEMRHYATVGLFVFMLIAGSVLGGCALGVTSSPSSQTSQLTVTATSGTMTQTFGITLTVTH